MTTITSKQRAHLRKLAHHLKPVVLVGSDGISEPVLASIRDALNTRELLKVKLQESAPVDVREAATAIADRLDDALAVQTIGRTIVLYRPHPDEPEIVLPAAGR
jgi:RNA-binding protein